MYSANPTADRRPVDAPYWSPWHRVRRECPVNRLRYAHPTALEPASLLHPATTLRSPVLPPNSASLAFAPMILRSRTVHSSLARAEERGQCRVAYIHENGSSVISRGAGGEGGREFDGSMNDAEI